MINHQEFFCIWDQIESGSPIIKNFGKNHMNLKILRQEFIFPQVYNALVLDWIGIPLDYQIEHVLYCFILTFIDRPFVINNAWVFGHFILKKFIIF